MNRILNKQQKRINLHPIDHNTHFTSLASPLTHKMNILTFFRNMSENTDQDTFQIEHTNYDEIRNYTRKKE